MGSPPPPDAPSPAQQAIIAADAGFALGPPAASLCGFKFSTISFKFKININLKLPPFPPTFFLSLGLNCDLSNPLNVSGGLSYGGGRVGTHDPDPDA